MQINYSYLLLSMCFYIFIVYIIVPKPNIIFKLNENIHKINKCSSN